MDPPAKKRDRAKDVEQQRQYRQRKKAVVNGMEEVRARNRQRYYERIAGLKAAGEYEAFKKHKCTEGKRRYHNMPKEQRDEVKRKNLIL